MFEDLRTFILADATVGGLVASRMYAQTLPQKGTFPALSYMMVSEIRGYVFAGADNTPSTRVQIDSWALTMQGALELDAAVLARIEAYRGLMGSPPTRVQGVFSDVVQSLYDSETELHRVSRDYFIHYEV